GGGGRRGGIAGPPGERAAAVPAPDADPPPSLEERGRARLDERLRAVATDRGEDAELVSSEPERMPGRARSDLQGLSEPREQRIAARMAERVVVALEPVHVEDDEHPRAAATKRPLELQHEPSAIPEPGQRAVKDLG